VGVIGAALLAFGPPALAVYMPLVDRVQCRSCFARAGRVLSSVIGVFLTYAWLAGNFVLMAHLAPLFRDASYPLLRGFAMCYPLALLLAALWWLALAVTLRFLLLIRMGEAIDLALTCIRWGLIVTPIGLIPLLPSYM
jgi:hypothetical protein